MKFKFSACEFCKKNSGWMRWETAAKLVVASLGIISAIVGFLRWLKECTGKAFTNWTLKLANISGGCVDFDEPQTGFNWGAFCAAQDVAAFKAKYPKYRKGTMFTIKSGKIARWVLGPHLAELTF